MEENIIEIELNKSILSGYFYGFGSTKSCLTKKSKKLAVQCIDVKEIFKRKEVNYMAKQKHKLKAVIGTQVNIAIPSEAKQVVRKNVFEPNIYVYADGDAYCAVAENFINFQESVAGFGKTSDEAVDGLLEAIKLQSSYDISSNDDSGPQATNSGQNVENLGDNTPEKQDVSDEEAVASEEVKTESVQSEENEAVEDSVKPLPYEVCDADHKDCHYMSDCKEHHKAEAEERIKQST